MRSLSISTVNDSALTVQHLKLSATAFDPETSSIYAGSEKNLPDGGVEVEVWKVDGSANLTSVANFTSDLTGTTWEKFRSNEITSFRFLPENRSLCVVLSGGDIALLAIDEEVQTSEFDIVGSVEARIAAATWSPDDTILALVTGNDSLMLMTKDFDVISEQPLRPTEFGEDAQVNVNWGSKQTQFHGSLGKAAAVAGPVTSSRPSPDDDSQPRISWRGDGAFFTVSTLDDDKRVLRVYNRLANLQSTSELAPGLEHPLSWRPSGNLIASTQRFGADGLGVGREGRHDVVFFERNGLRHGEFGLREVDKNSRIRDLQWCSDSTVLAVWIEREAIDVVQLWTTGNYHWYLKQEIPVPRTSESDDSNELSRFTSMTWHPEEALRLCVTTEGLLCDITFEWETIRSIAQPPNDLGTVCVVDGSTALLTPFRTQNVPPPMCSHKLALSTTPTPPTHVAFSEVSDTVAFLFHDMRVEVWRLGTRPGGGRGKPMTPTKLWSVNGNALHFPRQILLHEGAENGLVTVFVLGRKKGQSGDVVHKIQAEEQGIVALQGKNIRMICPKNDRSVIYQTFNGEIFSLDFDPSATTEITRFPGFCFHSRRISESVYVGQAFGKLYLNTLLIAANVNSFIVAGSFLIFTTTSHEATFAPLAKLIPLASKNQEELNSALSDWEKRSVERGSRIVTCIPSATSLVLQMPRGNLESVHPRPLVMEVVRSDIDDGDFRKAFLACRKHRIDLNVLVDHNPEKFMSSLESFVEQIEDVDFINLFLSGIGRSSQTPQKIADICEAIRHELERRDLKKYVNSILTAHVVKTPPDYEAGLSVLLRLRDNEPDIVEEAVKYIIFLVDADRLFDTALGMYDFSLVLMVAQHAQKDPREYLPFLRELRALEQYYQRFKIDDHLRRHSSALRNLHLAGPGYFDEAKQYIEQHSLYTDALVIWKNDPDQRKVLFDIYGDHLFDRRDFRDAALAFTMADRRPKAMVAYEKAHAWRELFALAVAERVSTEELVAMGHRVADDLSLRKRFSEAATVLLDYARDVPEAVAALAKGNDVSEALRVLAFHGQTDLLASVVHPTALDLCTQFAEDIQEMKEQLTKQVARLKELAEKKEEHPDAFYHVDDPNLHNIDVMTDVSTPMTTFTRYTAAPSTVGTRASKRTSRSKRKLERKAASGKKGTVDEEEYLLNSITKLVARYSGVQGKS